MFVEDLWRNPKNIFDAFEVHACGEEAPEKEEGEDKNSDGRTDENVCVRKDTDEKVSLRDDEDEDRIDHDDDIPSTS
jgi:hypothetical protein